MLKYGADTKDPWSQCILGDWYRDGCGIILQNYVVAQHWFEKSAEGGYGWAQCNLWRFYLNGRDGIVIDIEKAISWFEKIIKGNDFKVKSHAVKILTKEYYNKHLNDISKERLVILLKEYLENHDKNIIDPSDPWAQCVLADLYKNGGGIEIKQDYRQAAYWYQKSADNGYAWAQVNIGSFYLKGLGGLNKSLEDAVRWFQKAANQGNETARAELQSIKTIQSSKKYYIINRCFGEKHLDCSHVSSGLGAEGLKVHASSSSEEWTQWELIEKSRGIYYIFNKFRKCYLDCSNENSDMEGEKGKLVHASKAGQVDCTKWEIIEHKDGIFQIKNHLRGINLDCSPVRSQMGADGRFIHAVKEQEKQEAIEWEIRSTSPQRSKFIL